MSKIFEALQRAEQQTSGQGGEAPANTAPMVAVAELNPAQPPAQQEVAASQAALPEAPVAASPAEPVASPPAQPASAPAPSAELNSRVVVIAQPSSMAAEQYRILRTGLLKLRESRSLKVVQITSAGPADGKTVTALNLALSLAQKPGTRALLIEADLRKPALASFLNITRSPGLSDFLLGEAGLEEIVRPMCLPGFSLMTAGREVDAPGDLLHSRRIGPLMEAVRQRFDWVVLDAPPLNLLADQEVLAAYSDGILLVVRPMHTPRSLLALAAETLDPSKSLGIVINAAPTSSRYGHYYGYGYGQAYGHGPGRNGTPAGSTKRFRFSLARWRKASDK
jgi:protein-tyrosine kinase